MVKQIKKIGIIMFVAMIAMNACKKEDLVANNNKYRVNQADPIAPNENFVIITEEEKQFLYGQISIEDFLLAGADLVSAITKDNGYYFVGTVSGDNLLFAMVTESSHPEWYNRLHEHIERHFSDYPTIDPDNPPVGCIYSPNTQVMIDLINLSNSKYEYFVIGWSTEGNCWTFCNDGCGDIEWYKEEGAKGQ